MAASIKSLLEEKEARLTTSAASSLLEEKEEKRGWTTKQIGEVREAESQNWLEEIRQNQEGLAIIHAGGGGKLQDFTVNDIRCHCLTMPVALLMCSDHFNPHC